MSSFPLRSRSSPNFLLSEAAAALGAPWDGAFGDPQLRGIATLRRAGEGQLAPVAESRYLEDLPGSSASALLVSQSVVARLPEDEKRPRLVVPDVHQALAGLLEWLYPQDLLPPEIHPTAVIAPDAELGDGVRIGPYVVIEGGVRVGARALIGAHCVVGAHAQVGDDSVLHPHVVLYPGTQVGRGVILHSGVRLGVDGFGYVFDGERHRKVPQVGRCLVADDVEIGANTTIDRGSIDDTRVGAGVRIDNLVQLGHNVELDELVILVSQVGLAGSTRVGKGAVLGGQVGTAGHMEIGAGARIAGQAGIIGDVPPGATYMGFPGRPRREFLRSTAALGKVSDLLRRVRDLESEVERLRTSGGEGSPDDV